MNLIGYCEEDEPFNRMMVFEYAPNGTLLEHLHGKKKTLVSGLMMFFLSIFSRLISFLALSDKEMEHLDWSARMRIIMGTAYCLQYMHELNPPIAHSKLVSSRIYLTDDYAAKVTCSTRKLH